MKCTAGPWVLGLVGAFWLFPSLAGVRAGETVSLKGEWAFRLDPRDRGLAEGWWKQPLPQGIQLPGALQAQGFGEEVSLATQWTGLIVDRSWFTSPEYAPYRRPGQIKVPFWLQPERHYVGAAWYRRIIDIPEKWADKCLALFLERPHWGTRFWIDDEEVIPGKNSLSTPHVYDLRPVTWAGKHRLTIRVDNRMLVDVGENAHSVSDHTQGNWNGMVGRLEMQVHDKLWIESQRIFPKKDGTIRVEVNLRNEYFDPVGGFVEVKVCAVPTGQVIGQGQSRFSIPRGIQPDGQHIHFRNYQVVATVKLNQPPKPWDEFNPALYTVESRVEANQGRAKDIAVTSFGFREISTQGTQFVLNGRKLYLRGTLECCIFPRTGYPPTDVESWKRIIRVCKAHGLNHIRFHSWCPPEAAFLAADELGFYFHVECACWATIGEGKPIDNWIFEETERILKSYGNHPSFLLLAYGNEPGGSNQQRYLGKWIKHFLEKDGRRLYTGAAGWPQIPENQYHLTPDPRIQAWGAGLASRINARPPETRTDYRDYIRQRRVPVISHEIGQWCVYPNFDEIPKYTGYLKPKNFEVFRDSLRAHHMGDQARDFLLASGKLQTLCYKEDIESALRTPGMGGFHLLDLHDFPGQGTALVGVLDPFWEGKGYVTAEEYSRFCNSTVPLARMSKRVWKTDETFQADIEVAHFGPGPLEKAVPVWKFLNDNGKAVASGKLPAGTVPVDNGIALGQVTIPLKEIQAPGRFRLVVGLESLPFENDWDVWVYPSKLEETKPQPKGTSIVSPTFHQGILVVRDLDQKALETLKTGGQVLWLVPPERVRGDQRGKVALGFSSIFWNTAWTNRQAPHTLGILCNPKHPALASFPTDYHSNWQWWYLINQAQAMILDDLPAELRPIVQVIDDWFTNRKLGLVFEARVGPGKLVVCSIDLHKGLEQNPVARQLSHSLTDYMCGDRFKPSVDLTPDQLRRLVIRDRK